MVNYTAEQNKFLVEAAKSSQKKYNQYSWATITQQYNKRFKKCTSTSALRNRLQRIWSGIKAKEEGTFKNFCKLCKEPMRGHICILKEQNSRPFIKVHDKRDKEDKRDKMTSTEKKENNNTNKTIQTIRMFETKTNTTEKEEAEREAKREAEGEEEAEGEAEGEAESYIQSVTYIMNYFNAYLDAKRVDLLPYDPNKSIDDQLVDFNMFSQNTFPVLDDYDALFIN